MDIVIRPVKDRFLHEIVFPVFEMGMTNARVALERLSRVVADERTQLLLEVLLARGVDGLFMDLDADPWIETVYRLLFRDWEPADDGWRSPDELPGYAGDWHEALHLSLMLEHPRYPYWEEAESVVVRDACIQAPEEDLGLAALVAGRWDPVPRFAPHEVLPAHTGRGVYKAGEAAIADWSYRSADAVSFWARQLPTKLGRLLKREEQRLRPLEMPESSEILAYWMGKQPEPPVLAVAFSGLGPRASGWVREIGALARQIREAAAAGQGLTVIVPKHGSPDGGFEVDPY
jgi:hypothetical protein